jgi:hypothetical protein
MMACPEPLMEQERRLLDILQGELSFELSEKGALILTGGYDRKTLARRLNHRRKNTTVSTAPTRMMPKRSSRGGSPRA